MTRKSRTMNRVLITLIGVIFTSCQKRPVSATFWSSSPSAAVDHPPAALVVEPTRVRALRLGEETVLTQRRQVGGAYLRDAWIKNVRNTTGKIVYADGRIYGNIPSDIERRAKILTTNPEYAARIFVKLKHDLPAVADAGWMRGPSLEVSPRERLPGWRILWEVDYLDRADDQFKRLHVNLSGTVVASSIVSAEFVEAPATVYPKGPKSSELEEVMLQGLLNQDGLASARGRVTCSDEPSIIDWKKFGGSFRFPPEDHRFDAVQAYFYADRAQSWFRDNAGLELAAPLTVDVFAGGTQAPRNTACYYFNIIRLGAGDGKVYRDIMRDPTVVMHEVSHAFIETVSHLGTQEEGGSLNEAFADYFAASMVDSPRMGEVSYMAGPYRRNLDNNSVFKDRNGGLYHDSLIVSGTLWEIRTAVGPEKALRLALRVLARLNPDSDFAAFKTACSLATQDAFTPEEVRRITEILDRRGWGNP